MSLKPLPVHTVEGRRSSPFPFEGATPVEDGHESADRLRQLEAMLARNQEKAAEIEREAYDKAYAAGEKAGLALGQKRAEQILERMQGLLDACAPEFEAVRLAMCEAVVDIGGALAAWLIGDITEAERNRLLDMAKKTAQAMPGMIDMKIAVHPDDYTRMEKLLGETGEERKLIADASVRPGAIRLFSKSRDVLVDPIAAIADGVAHIKSGLLNNARDNP